MYAIRSYYAAFEAGDRALADIGDQFSVDDVHRTRRDLDVANAQRVDFLDQFVEQVIAVAQAVVRRDGHAILEARGNDLV